MNVGTAAPALRFSLSLDDEDPLWVGSATVDVRRAPMQTQEVVERAERAARRTDTAESEASAPLFFNLEIGRTTADLPYTLQRQVDVLSVVLLDRVAWTPLVVKTADGLVVRRLLYRDGQERWSVTASAVGAAAGDSRLLVALPADTRLHLLDTASLVVFVNAPCMAKLVQDALAPDPSCPSRPSRACKRANRAHVYSTEHPSFDACAIFAAWSRHSTFERLLAGDNFASVVRAGALPSDNGVISDARELARAYGRGCDIARVVDIRHGGFGAQFVGRSAARGELIAVLLGRWSRSEPLVPGFTFHVPAAKSGLPYSLYLDATNDCAAGIVAHVCQNANSAFEPISFGDRIHIGLRALQPLARGALLTVTYAPFDELWFACRCGVCEALGRGAFAPSPRSLASPPLPATVSPCPPMRSARDGGRPPCVPPEQVGLPRLAGQHCVFAKFELALQRVEFADIAARMVAFGTGIVDTSNPTHFRAMPLPNARTACEIAVSVRDALLARRVSYFAPSPVHLDASTRALCHRLKQASPASVSVLDTTNMQTIRRHVAHSAAGFVGCIRFAYEADRGFCGRVCGVSRLRAGTVVALYSGEVLHEQRFDQAELARLDSSSCLLALGSPARSVDAVLIAPLVFANEARLYNHAPLAEANMLLRVFAQDDGELVAILYLVRDVDEGQELRWCYFKSRQHEALYLGTSA